MRTGPRGPGPGDGAARSVCSAPETRQGARAVRRKKETEARARGGLPKNQTAGGMGRLTMDSKPVLATSCGHWRCVTSSLVAKRRRVNCLKGRTKAGWLRAEPWKGSTERESKGTDGGAGKPAKGVVSVS